MHVKEIISALHGMTPAERAEIRRLLGVGDDHSRVEIDSRTGKEKEKTGGS